MGQKVHPGGFRVGVIHDWKSNWWTGRQEFAAYLLEDVKIRRHILGKLSHAAFAWIPLVVLALPERPSRGTCACESG